VPVLVGSTAEDSDANLTASPTNLTTTRADFEAFVVSELPWANRSVRRLMLATYANDTGLAFNGTGTKTNGPGPRRQLNVSYSKWYWAAKHMLADAEMYCPNRRAARWITQANTAAAAAAGGQVPRAGFAYHFLWGHTPLQGSVGNAAAHNTDTAFWYHVLHSANASVQMNSAPERALSLQMAEYWIRHATSGDPNPSPGPGATSTPRPAPSGAARVGMGGGQATAWPPYPLHGGGPMNEPLLVLDASRGAGGRATSTHVVWGGRNRNCAFWDRVDAALTPED